MDYQNAEFYRLNKNSTAIIYNFADELITYRKETDDQGNLHIVEYRKVDGRKGKKVTTRRVLRPYEMSVEAFDAWKVRLTAEAHEELNKGKRETRDDFSIENLHETDMVSVDTFKEEEERIEKEQEYDRQATEAYRILSKLTPIQRERYLKNVVFHKSTVEIAAKEGVAQPSVYQSIESAKEKIEKLKNK